MNNDNESRYKDYGSNQAKEALEQAAKYLYLIIGLNILFVVFITLLIAFSAALWAIMTMGLIILALSGLIFLIRFLRRTERQFEEAIEVLSHVGDTGEEVDINFLGGFVRISIDHEDRPLLEAPEHLEPRE